MKFFLLLISTFLCCHAINAQRNYSYNNKIGVGIDATFFNLQSEDVAVNGKIGWSAGLENRSSYRPFIDFIFGIHLFNNKFSVQEAISLDEIEMNVIGAELKFLLAYKIANKNYLSLEAGPALSFNGEFKVANSNYDDSIITGPSAVTIASFQQTTPFNVNGIIGLSGGLEKIRVSIHYHYSFLDVLNGKNFNSEELNGNMGYVTAGVRYLF